MARFKVVRYLNNGKTFESEVTDHSRAHNTAVEWLNTKPCKTLVVLRDSEGEDHPDNAGKFFLYQIFK